MLWFLHFSTSNALRNDQWPMLEEIREFNEGHVGWNYLWTPYWGHRIVFPRLILLADERWFHSANAPLVLINLLALGGLAAVLMSTAWRLLGRTWTSVTLLSLTAIAGLMLSSIQLENIVFGMAVQNTVAYVSAIASIALMDECARSGGPIRARTWLAIASALLCTLCFGAGLLLWPVLLVEAILSGAELKLLGIIGALGTAAAFIYLHSYTNVANMGMGTLGAIHRPIHAALIAALVLGGPFSNVNTSMGIAVGTIGLILTGYLLYQAFRNRAVRPAESTVLISVLLFMVGCALSIAVGRISPEWLAQHSSPLPGRYLTFAFIFWSAALPLALFDRKNGGSRIAAGVTMLVAGALLLGFIPTQLDASEQWLRTYRLIDAAADGFLVGAFDQTYMNQMYPDNGTLARDVPYLKEHGLSIFAEPRAKWFGEKLTEVFQMSRATGCSGMIEEITPTETGALRLVGYVSGLHVNKFDKTDLVFTNDDDRVVGLGRTLAEDEQGGVRFLGYSVGSSGRLTPWVIGTNSTACRVTSTSIPGKS